MVFFGAMRVYIYVVVNIIFIAALYYEQAYSGLLNWVVHQENPSFLKVFPPCKVQVDRNSPIHYNYR
jgi:hypothetical protein